MNIAYSTEQKRLCVKAFQADKTVTQISNRYNIPRSTIAVWVKNPDKYLVDDNWDEIENTADGKPDRKQLLGRDTSPSPKKDGFSLPSVVLAIPDLHCPFHHVDALAFLIAVRDKLTPTHIVCLGDELDAHAYSKWPKDPDGMGPGQELKAAIEALVPFYVAFPKVQVCISNHTIRPRKMMMAAGLGRAFWPRYETMLNAPEGWTWHEHIIIDNVRYIHGDNGKGGQNGWTQNSEVYHQSVVVGHWHSKAGVYYDSKMFNANAGCLIDEKAYAFDYAKNSHKRPNLGCVIVTDGRKATFLPMLTDENNRWVGHL